MKEMSSAERGCQSPEGHERDRAARGAHVGINGKREPKDGSIRRCASLNALQNEGDEFVLRHHAAVGSENRLCEFVDLVQACGPHRALELAQSDALDLTDALACHFEVFADFLQCLLWLSE